MLEEFITSTLTTVSDSGIAAIAQNTFELIKDGVDVEPNADVPDDNCCHLYDKTSFGGGYKKLCMDDNKTYSEFSLPELDFNDKAESVWCGKEIDIQICKDGFYKCD